MDEKRLDKIVAAAGLLTRTEARALIKAGRVTVDGAPCRAADAKVDPEKQSISLSGEELKYRPFHYIMMNKPVGVVSATEDKRERTAVSLLPERIGRTGLFPAGRLDKDTEGFLLLTTDGPLAHRITSPAHHVDKEYLVQTDKPMTVEDGAAFRDGVALSREEKCRPAFLTMQSDPCWARLVLREGKFHQIKRMMEARGKRVVYLKRVRIGPVWLDDRLEKGGWRPLTEEEEKALKNTAGVE